MIVNKGNLKKLGACHDGTAYALEHLKGMDGAMAVSVLVKAYKIDWANWAIARLMDKENRIKYAIYAANQVIKIYEDKYPDDKIPREAINAAKRYLKNPTEENRSAAYAAANAAAYAAAYAANAAANADMKKKIIRYGLRLLSQEAPK